MSSYLLGTVWNGVKTINVELAASGSGWRRIADPITSSIKEAAFEKVKSAFEAGKLFKPDEMEKMNKIVIKYVSKGNSNSLAFVTKMKQRDVS